MCLGFLNAQAQFFKHYLKSPFKIYDDLDFTGVWKSINTPKDESYTINIIKKNGKYIANYCFSIKDGLINDCANEENMIWEIHENYIDSSLFSKLGGMVTGLWHVIDAHTLSWTAQLRMGENIAPLKMKFTRDKIPLYPNYSKKKLKIDRVFDSNDFLQLKENGLNIELTRLQINNSPDIDSIKVIPFEYDHGNVKPFLVTEFSSTQKKQLYLVTFNREFKELSRMALNPIENEVSGNYKIKTYYEVKPSFEVLMHQKLVKNNQVKFEKERIFKLNNRGIFEEIEYHQNEDFTKEEQKYLSYFDSL